MSSRFCIVAVALSVACLGLDSVSFAQSSGERAVEGERVYAERRAEELRRSLERGEPGADLSRGAPAAAQDETCFPIDKIAITGATLLSQRQIDQIAFRHSKSCLGQSGIKALLSSIDNAYAEKGFITSRAYLPKQDLRSRKLSISIVEGFVEKIVLEDNGSTADGLMDKLRVRGALPLAEGDNLNLRDLEQGLDQLSAPRSAQATVDLKPGEKPGGSVLKIKTQSDDRYRGFVFIETEDRDFSGLTRARISLEADDLLSLSDSAQLFLSGTENSNSIGGSWRIPWGYWSFAVSGSYSDETSRLTPTSDLITLSANGFFEARNLLYRDARHKVSVLGSVSYRQSERLINTTDLTPQKLTTLRGGVAHEYRGDGYVVFSELGLSSGAPLFGGADDPDGLGPSAPRAEFQKFDASLTYVRRLSDQLQLYTTTFGQAANVAALRSEEQLSIGGWSSVRGYEDAGFTGDVGGFMRNEISASQLGSLFRKRRLGAEAAQAALEPAAAWMKALDKLQPFLFADLGYVRSGALKKGEAFYGVGGGLRIDVNPFSLNAEIAHGVSEPRFALENDVQARVSLTWQVF